MLLLATVLALAAFQAPAPHPTRGAEALSLFGSAGDDRTLVYLAWGAPATRTRVDCPALLRPAEVWTYAAHPRLGPDARLVFFQEVKSAEYRYWTPRDGEQVLAPKRPLEEIASGKGACAEAAVLASAVKTVGARQRDPDQERESVVVGRLARPASSGAPAPLKVERTIRFPEMASGRMKLELSLGVDRAGLASRRLGDETFYGVELVGEIRKGDRRVDDFRYRFDFAASNLSGTAVPLAIEREVAPGEYALKLTVTDLYANAAAVLAETLRVPGAPGASAGKDEQAIREAAREAAKASFQAPEGGGAIRFVPPASEVLTGRVRLETRSASDVAYAEFYLDGARVLTKRRPPFEVELDLGDTPRRRLVKVIGYGKDGKVVAQDERTLNEGREAFRVRLTSPEKGRDVSGPTRVAAEVSIPGTRRLKQLEFYLDETRAAVLYKPPFEQTVDVPRSAAMAVLRAVATLDDGTSAEDVRYLNAPPLLSEVDVRAVELYTTVLDKGRPVTGLSRESFRVLEDGVPQDLTGFEVVSRLPLALGLAIDTSTSMDESMGETQKAATQFLKDVMAPRDRCFLVTFASEPRLASRFTTDREQLAEILGGLRAEGMTALWDAVESGLFQFQGLRGRKAYVLLTDGEDSASKNRYEKVLDYAKKSGVAVYFIGMKIPVARMDIRFKLSKLATETGGAVYFIESVRSLARIYRQIDEELRSQYLLSYLPKNAARTGGKWRKVEVKVSPPNLTARTISGYYP